MRRILIGAFLLSLFGFVGGTAHAACNNPNPNLLGPPFVDGCPLPASALNKLQNAPTLTNTSLKAISTAATTAGQAMFRVGFATAGDGGALTYTFSTSACSLNAGAGDNGSQVKPTSGGGCWLANFAANPPNVVQFGADPTGVADSGPAFKAAYDALAGVQQCVSVPAGTYLISTQVVMSGKPPCFQGVKPNAAENGAAKTGTWIHVTDASLQPFAISGATAAGKSGFSSMGFYNDQPTPASGWTPTAYQYFFTVTSGGQDLEFRDLNFFNVTHCISLASTGRVTLDGISGQPVGTCLLYDNILDIAYLDHVHLWPFWSADTDVLKYTQQNVDPIVFERADSPMMGRIFTLGYHSGIKFASSGNGVTTGFQIDSLQTDVGKYGVWVTGTNTQGHIANFRHSSGNYDLLGTFATGSEAYRDESSASDVMIANFQSFSSNESAIHMTGGSNLRVGNMEVYNCNGANDSSTAVTMDSGGVIAIANLPVTVGSQCAGTVFYTRSASSWFVAPSIQQNWTPTVIGSTSGGLANTYTSRYGKFWFDGTKVHLEFDIAVSAFSAAIVGNVSIGGLPFAASGFTGQRGTCSISSFAGLTLDTNFTSVSGVIPGTTSIIQLLESGSGQNTTLIPASTLSAGITIIGSCTYQVN